MRPTRRPPRGSRLAGLGVTTLLHAAILIAILLHPAEPPPPEAATPPIELLPLPPAAPTPPVISRQVAEQPPVPAPSERPPPRQKPVQRLVATAPAPPAIAEAVELPSPDAEPQSTASITPPAIAPAPSPTPENAEATASYVGLLARRLAEVKRYPATARAARREGIVQLFFRLDRTGRVLSWHIARSSGYDVLDAEVAAMIEAAAPFPPFPSAMTQAAESFLVPVEFSLR